METLAYLHLALDYEESAIAGLAPGLNADLSTLAPALSITWPRLSGRATTKLLSLLCTVVILGSSSAALALVQRGDSGTDVSALQTRLAAVGVYDGPVTGFFGELTEAAVIQFQQINGLVADGIAGPNTLAILGGGVATAVPASIPTATATPAQSFAPAAVSNSSSGVLTRGVSGTAVTDLQTRLQAAGVYDGPITGFYGELTEAAVIRFQQARGLTVDGIAGPSTLAALQGGGAVAPQSFGPTPTAVPTATPAATSTTLRMGSSGAEVLALQQRLRDLGFYDFEITGFYGDVTEISVARFQQANGLTPDGIAGPATLSLLRSSQATGFENVTTAPPVTTVPPVTTAPPVTTVPPTRTPAIPPITAVPAAPASGTLRPGDRGNEVAELQRRLLAQGYNPGSIDGVYGPGTEQAVRAFQSANNLPADGVAGQSTLMALDADFSRNPYVVVVPGRGDLLSMVQQSVPSAFQDRSGRGSFVNAGAFTRRSEAESTSRQLRSRGFDSRVEHFSSR